MIKLKSIKLTLALVLTLFIIIIFILNLNNVSYDFDYLHNRNKFNIVPNIAHYIIFNQHELHFDAYLSVLSVIKFEKPEKILIHTNQIELSGDYWNRIKNLNRTNPVIFINYMSLPTHVFGQKLSSVYHASDVARILVLQEWGGIYLDFDVLVLKSLDPFRHYEMVVGLPENEYMGTQILLAAQNARFLKYWLDGYKHYKPSNWYYNAGHYPTEQIIRKMPYLTHTVSRLFGVQNLLDFLYRSHELEEWKEFYAVHLLSRHSPAPEYMDESLIATFNNTFGEIANYILYDNKL